MPFDGKVPYDEYLVYGPYYHQKEKRNYYNLILKVNSAIRTTLAVAKYVMETTLGRKLPEGMEVDHKDNDKTNDDIFNLTVLTKRDNKKKSQKSSETMVELICPNCEKKFIKRWGHTHLIRGGNPTCCSKHCGGQMFHKRRKQ